MKLFRKLQRAFLQLLANLLLEQPARRHGWDRLIQSLEQSGQALEKRAAAAAGHPGNQRSLAHIIGIERWGQRRLHVALGEPLTDEEYDQYRPAAHSWPDLLNTFRTTRQATIGLGKSLRMAGVDPNTAVEHNQYGTLTLLGWLYYLDLHARLESLRMN